MPVPKIFSYLEKALKGPINSLASTYKMSSAISSSTSGHKRSAHLQTKIAKALGVDIATLADQDILFINSLTTCDIAKLGAKCKVKFPTLTLEDAASKLKSMEQIRYKFLLAKVVQARII